MNEPTRPTHDETPSEPVAPAAAGEDSPASPPSAPARLALGALLRSVRPVHGVFLALWVAHLIPLWSVEWLPFMDLPQHLSTISVLHHHGDAELGYAAFFDVDLLSTPYLAYYLTVDLLAHAMPVEAANTVFISLYALLLPLSAWRFLTAFGREPALSFLAFPLVYGTFLFMGFVNFVAALPFLLFGLGALKRWQDHGGWGRFAWLVFHTAALYFSHTQVYLLYLGSAGLYVLLAWPGWRRFFQAASHLAPTFALLVIWILRSGVLAGEESWSAGRAGRNASPAGAKWEELATSLRELPPRLIDAYRDSSDDLLVVLLLFAFGALLLFRRAPRVEGARAWLREHAIELVALTLLGLHFALPVSYKWIWPLNWRLAPVAFLVGLAWLRIRPLRVLPQTALSLVLGAIALYGVVIHQSHFEEFQEEVGPLAEILDAAEPRRRTMGLIFDRGSGIMTTKLAPYLHFAQYYQLRRGGMADFSFANFAQSPVSFHERTGPPKLPVRWEWTPERLRYPRTPKGAADYYDYYLVRGKWRGQGPFGRHLGHEIREVKKAGRWRLFERVPR